MSQSPKLGLSYVLPQQAQKHVTVNESFRRLDALVNLTVHSQNTSNEPTSPAEGDSYILPATVTGTIWTDMGEGNIAVFQDGTWIEIIPQEGWRAWIIDEQTLFVFTNHAWEEVTNNTINNAAIFGINTQADVTNKFAVKSDAILHSHDDITPGSGNARHIINKNTTTHTASVLFQTGYSGRAEYGLNGDDVFSIQVSANGTSWSRVLSIDPADGDLNVESGSELAFPTTINGVETRMSIFAQNADLVFSKPTSNTNLADGAKYFFSNVGSQNAGNAFWQGIHFASPIVTENTANRFPRVSFYWSYSSSDDPSDLRFNIIPGAAGTLKTQLAFKTLQNGEIYFDGGPVRIGSIGGSTSAKLTVDGAIRVAEYQVTSTPAAASQGAGAIIFVQDEIGGATLAFSDGTNWRRTSDGNIIS